eukprot:m51a1_g8548 hypothetical protein (386) ;mRNA; f:80056-81602
MARTTHALLAFVVVAAAAAATTTFECSVYRNQVPVSGGSFSVTQYAPAGQTNTTIFFASQSVLGPGPTYGYVRSCFSACLTVVEDSGYANWDLQAPYTPGYACRAGASTFWVHGPDRWCPHGAIWVIDKAATTIPAGTSCSFKTLSANRAPVANRSVAPQSARVGEAFRLHLQPGTFVDPDGDALVLAAAGPAWLAFNGSDFSGTPTAAGVFNVSVTASDPRGASATLWFALVVSEPPAIVATCTLYRSQVGIAGNTFVATHEGPAAANGTTSINFTTGSVMGPGTPLSPGLLAALADSTGQCAGTGRTYGYVRTCFSACLTVAEDSSYANWDLQAPYTPGYRCGSAQAPFWVHGPDRWCPHGAIWIADKAKDLALTDGFSTLIL